MFVLFIMAFVAMIMATGLIYQMLFGKDYYKEAERDY